MKDYININKNAYNQLAPEFALRNKELITFQNNLRQYLSKYVKPFDSVLEIGSGTGMALKIFEQLKCNTIAIELSDKMCEFSKENAPKSIIINQNVLEISFYPNQFDLICAFAVIHTFSLNDSKGLLSRISSWLKPSGTFIFDTMKYDSSHESLVKTGIHKDILKYQRIYTESELDSLIACSGLKVKDKSFTEDLDAKKIWIRYACSKI